MYSTPKSVNEIFSQFTTILILVLNTHEKQYRKIFIWSIVVEALHMHETEDVVLIINWALKNQC